MPIPTRWKVAGATAAAAGLAVGGVFVLAQGDDDDDPGDNIELRDSRPAAEVEPGDSDRSGTDSPAVTSVDSPVSDASPADPTSPSTPASATSPASPADPQSPASPADPQSPASPADPASPASAADPASPASVDSPAD